MEWTIDESGDAIPSSPSTAAPMKAGVVSIKGREGERITGLEGFLGDDFSVGNSGRDAMESEEHSLGLSK